MQLSRLKSAGLFSYFSDVFVSDEIGFENPDSRFFSKCLHRIHFRPEEVLMVGDSLQADIAGYCRRVEKRSEDLLAEQDKEAKSNRYNPRL